MTENVFSDNVRTEKRSLKVEWECYYNYTYNDITILLYRELNNVSGNPKNTLLLSNTWHAWNDNYLILN